MTTSRTGPLRVLHVVPGISPKYGGPVNVPGMVRALIRHGVDATLLTTNADPDRRLEVPLGTRVVRDGVPYLFHNVWPIAGRYGLAPSLVRTLRSAMGRTDLVHIHWLYNFSCVAAARVARSAGVPFVIQPRGSLDPHMLRLRSTRLKHAYLSTVGRPLLRDPAAVIFTAEQERAVASYARARPEWIVPNGLEWEEFADLPPAGTFRTLYPQVRGPYLLFVGRLSRQKALDLLLGAFARVSRTRPGLWLVLAGPDHEGHEAEVRAMAAELGVTDRVLFTGLLGTHPKLAAFVDADLFVLPSYSENFGRVITEALACGLPVLISDRVNIHAELAAADAATVVTCSIDDVAAGIEATLSDPEGRRRMATRGRTLVRERYTWDAIVPGLIERYLAVAATHRSAAAPPRANR